MERNKEAVTWSFWGHEPLNHLRRMGGESIFNLGEWADEWYDYMHSEKMMKKLHDAGINLIYTHFFKGFGLEHEKEEMENTKRLCGYAKKYGIKVLGYCQLGSLYYETMLDEAEDLEDWAIHDENGKIVCWLGEYYRWSPCFNSVKFKEYIKKVIKYGIEEIGLSGFHFDNSYNVACHCTKCTQAFRAYLTKNVESPEKIMGLRHFNHVRIPREDNCPNTHDPLYIWWLKYKADLCAGVHDELFSYVKKCGGPEKIVLHNPCFPRATGRTFARRGFEPSRLTKACDFVFAENAAYIRKEKGIIISQVEAFKYGECFDYRVFDTSWLHDEQGNIRLPKNNEEISRFLAQSMIFSGICGSPWTNRTLKEGHKNVFEDSGLFEFLQNALRYYLDNYDLYNRKAHNHVKLLYSDINCMFSQDDGLLAVRECEDEMVSRTIPFSVIVEKDIDNLEKGQTLVIPKVLYSDNALYDKLISAAQRGVNVLFVGKFGLFNENGKERAGNDRVFSIDKVDGFYQCEHNWIDKLSELNKEYEITTSSDSIIVETKSGGDGELILHLLNADNENEIEELKLSINGFQIKDVDCISMDNTTVKDHDFRVITLKNVKTMATLVLKN